MKTKTKIMAFVSLASLTMVLLMVGVWALKTVNFTIDGNLSYIAPGIEATISKGVMSNGVWVNANDATTKMPLTQITRTDTEETLTEKFSYWQNINLNFNDAGDDIQITFSITNNSSSKYIILDVSTSYTSANNCTISVDTTSTTLAPKGSHTFTLTMAVTDKTANATMTNFAVVFNMELANSASNESILKYDEKNDYYYVTMGHTDTIEEIRWRLVGLDGEKFTGTTAPTSGTGTFILETYIEETNCYFNEDISDGVDYATSDVREYLKGDYVSALNLEEYDIFNQISSRSIADLYVNLEYEMMVSTLYDCPVPSGVDGEEEDKLWLMSLAEICTILGGGTAEEMLDWGDSDDLSLWLSWQDCYWTRSFQLADIVDIGEGYDLVGVWYIETYMEEDEGEIYYDAYEDCVDADAIYALRPAFNLDF